MKRLFIAVLMILSVTTAFAQIVNNAEYFFDNDPGPGNGTPISISTPGVSVSFPAQIPINLSPGFHWLGIRVKDSDGKWSLFQRRDFYVSQPGTDLPIITKAEYFFDNDPGVGGGTPLNFQTPGFSVSQTFPITVPVSMAAGTHRLAIRVKDQAGHWSLFQRDSIVVGGSTASITCPGNVVVTAASGQCSAIVNNIDPTVSPQGSSYTYTLTGATTGSGTGTASGKTFNVGVTTLTYALTDAPSTSCSFSVTVNPGTTASVNINTAITTICSGQLVSFAATPVNGGNSPSYQWKLNGNNITGAIYSTYQSSSLVNGDVVSVVMTSSLSCASSSTVASNNISIAVTTSVAPVVNIQVSATTICAGTTVTFTATPTDGGANPVYQWKLNGNNVGSNSPIYQSSSLQNGDKVKVVMTSSALCASPSSAVSEEVTMTVNAAAIPSVTIETNAEAICTGQLATFTALPKNAGNNPVYEWTLNNNAVGSNSPTYQCATLADGDNVRVTMAPSKSCGNNTPVVSNTITMTVGADVTPSVTISAVNSTACAGTLAIFYASPLSGAGSSPSYQWKRNGINIPGATNSTYQSSSLQNGDVIRVAMTSSLSCANPQTVLSHDSATMIISSVPLTPSVTISASATNICQGQTVLFTALPTNGGDVPGYQWKLNGINVGDNIDTFSTNSLQHGDKVTVEMATSVPCSTSPTATSAPVTMTVTTVTTFYADFDGDGYGSGASGVAEACTAPAGYVSNNSDCNDDNASVHPGATEICGNGIDDDCDGQTDEACGNPDNDGDGYTVAQGDCNDNNASIHPGATEICGNGIDDNCNGQTDENCTEGLPTLITKTYPVKEGDVGFTIVNVEVTLDKAATKQVSVNYATSNANATAGLDYVAANGVLTIPVGATSGIIQLKVIGDLLREDNEIFWLTFSNPVNVLLGADPRTRIMIIDDDKGKPNSASPNKDALTEVSPFKIPTVARRNAVWMIPQISNYENEVLILNVQGQIVNRFINYRNQTSLANVSAGLYFYRIRITENPGQYKYYSGRLLITE